MIFWIIRLSFVVLMAVLCRAIGLQFGNELLGLYAGVGLGVIFVLVEIFMKNLSLRGLSSVVFGSILGLVMAKIVHDILVSIQTDPLVVKIATPILTFIFIYIGLTFSLKKKDEFALVLPYIRFSRTERDERPVVLDTSAIIDGRVFDIAKTGFLKAKLIVPSFVIDELQRLADSQDHNKRQKGRIGLDRLNKAQKEMAVDIYTDDISSETEVDAKLIHLARLLDSPLVTMDYNLGRVASLKGVKVLNINDLVLAIQPNVETGDVLTNIRLIREGKDSGQAVGYTPEGIMVVVENARHLLGRAVSVEVYNVIQTQSGRIIFAKLTQNRRRNNSRSNS